MVVSADLSLLYWQENVNDEDLEKAIADLDADMGNVILLS